MRARKAILDSPAVTAILLLQLAQLSYAYWIALVLHVANSVIFFEVVSTFKVEKQVTI